LKEFYNIFKKAPNVREQIAKKKPIMFQSFSEVKETKTGKKYFDSNILWDEIVKVNFVGNMKTYDLSVKKHHNFIAENILVHNTYWLLEFMMRAVKQNRKVAFFQAGDMTENQFLMRICIYLSQKSNREKYCGEQYIPVLDCVRNQNDTCEKKIRACNFGFTTMADEDIRKEITKETLIEAFNDYPKYRNCYNCVEWLKKPLGAVWLKKVNIGEPLSLLEAKERVNGFFVENNRQVKISTHANGTLSVSKIDTILENWKRKGFEPDIILIDYVDILEAERKMEVRHQENDKWKALRRLSQEKDCLVITVTQADADSYEKDILSLKNFSEDKRKYGHVTAMFGLNQDKKGREKQIGVMRINQLTAREDDFVVSNTIKVLQKLQIGRPFLGSYY
ncbi:MAG TPA: hypothetical protein VK982_12050, partial [Bacteroidales bacterium]|nr:hypothetical protein [Bacteroidales bacterium]